LRFVGVGISDKYFTPWYYNENKTVNTVFKIKNHYYTKTDFVSLKGKKMDNCSRLDYFKNTNTLQIKTASACIALLRERKKTTTQIRLLNIIKNRTEINLQGKTETNEKSIYVRSACNTRACIIRHIIYCICRYTDVL